MNGSGVPLGDCPSRICSSLAGGGCVPVMKIFHTLERRFPQAKVFYADLPQVAVEDIKRHHLTMRSARYDRLIEFLDRDHGPEDWTRTG